MPAPARQSEIDAAAALAEALRTSIGRLNRRLREEANFGEFTLSQAKVIVRLERDGPATVTALAEAEGMRPQSMSGIISALRAAGMIDGAPHPEDGRQTVLSLSGKCRDSLAAGRAAKQDWLFRTLQSTLTAAEQQQLADAVVLLDRLIVT